MVVLSDSRGQDCPDTSRTTVAYVVFLLGVPIDNCTHVSGPVSQSISESYYNAEWNSVMDISHFRILINDLLKKYQDMVP